MKLVEQAVILCGGLGTRLRPLTDSLPKPMAPVNGRPFLAYLIQQVREQGIRRVLLLTGYRGETIRSFFRDGSDVGVDISYSHGPTEWETARRVWEARNALDPAFMLLYSDNYVPFTLEKLVDQHARRGKTVTLRLQRKARGNVRLSADGAVELYDPSRSAPGLTHVELGYMVVERDGLVGAISEPDASLSNVLSTLSKKGQLAATVTSDPYHSISDMERLRLAERYLASKRILLIDRDGTINAKAARGTYVTGWDEFRWNEPTVEGMRTLSASGFKFIILSNQAGIARGMLDADEVGRINARMCDELARQGIEILDTYLCPHHWDDGCDCRKPAPGMFFLAAAEHLVRMDRTIYIGDDPRDSEAAYNAECLSILVGPDREAEPRGKARPTWVAETLPEVVPEICRRFEQWELVP